VAAPEQVGRWTRARYAVQGAAEELSRTLPLAHDEPLLLEGGMRLRAHGLPRPVVLRLTPPRLVLLAHYAFQPDRVLELPHAAVRSVGVDGGAVAVEWTGEGGARQVLRLTRWTGSREVAPALRDVDVVAELLHAWLVQPGGPAVAAQPHRHRR
jgi:hypothetical protein